MTTSTRTDPQFTVRSSFHAYRALLVAALCVFIASAFLLDVQRGASQNGANAPVEQRT
jgi:hypothetical protein